MKNYDDAGHKVSLSFRCSERLRDEISGEATKRGMTESSYLEFLRERHERADSRAFFQIEALQKQVEAFSAESATLRHKLGYLKSQNAEQKIQLAKAFLSVGLNRFDREKAEKMNRDFVALEKAYPGRSRFEILVAALDRARESEESFLAQTIGEFWENLILLEISSIIGARPKFIQILVSKKLGLHRHD